MKKKIAAIPLILVLMMLFAGCGGGTILTGVWYDEQQNIYQFEKTNLLGIAAKDGSASMSCIYELTPDNDEADSLTGRIKITITPARDKATVAEGKYKIEEDKQKLTITGDNGQVSVLTKGEGN